MGKMFKSLTSRRKQLDKRPSSSSRALEKRAAGQEEETRRFILIKVKSREKEVHFKLKRTIKLQKILQMFCKRAQVKYSSMRFIIDGSRFPLTATPDELHMSDGDEIQAMGWQCWGRHNATVS